LTSFFGRKEEHVGVKVSVDELALLSVWSKVQMILNGPAETTTSHHLEIATRMLYGKWAIAYTMLP